MQSAAISTTTFALMHACLAYASPEVQTLNKIIYSRHQAMFLPRVQTLPASRPFPLLPTEILLIIRSDLVETLTRHLISISHASLRRFEAEFRNEHCAQCREHQEYICGYDRWEWDEEPIGCNDMVCCRSPVARAVGSVLPIKRLTYQHYDCIEAWLEAYLSHHLTSSFPSSDIWSIVGDVLEELDCERVPNCAVLRPHVENSTPPGFARPSRRSIPGHCVRLRAREVPSKGRDAEGTRAQMVLHHLEEVLGLQRLSFVESVFFSIPRPSVTPPKVHNSPGHPPCPLLVRPGPATLAFLIVAQIFAMGIDFVATIFSILRALFSPIIRLPASIPYLITP